MKFCVAYVSLSKNKCGYVKGLLRQTEDRNVSTWISKSIMCIHTFKELNNKKRFKFHFSGHST